MKIKNIIQAGFASLILMACSDDYIPEGPKTTEIPLPVELILSEPSAHRSRVIGDPGYDDELQPPSNLYVFSWIKISSSDYELYYTKKAGLTASDWTYIRGSGEDQDSRYRLKSPLTVTFNTSSINATEGELIGKVYAIASRKALTDTQLQSITTAAYQSVLTSARAIQLTASPDNTFQTATASFAGWTSDELRDLYSNPIGDPAMDEQNTGNGQIYFDSQVENGVRCGVIRMYHCAAKIDFTWEVASLLRPTTSVQTITVRNLPTVCRLFEPTQNPATPTVSQDIPTSTETKHIGRAYFYALQPATGEITYDVDFAGSRPDLTGLRFTPSAVDPVFTGWYRIIASVSAP